MFELERLVVPDFLPAERCARLRREMAESPAEPAPAVRATSGYAAARASGRRSLLVEVSAATRAELEGRITAELPRISEFFSIPLRAAEPPQFLRYRRGDFFRAHSDCSSGPGVPDRLAARKVSLVVFLSPTGDPALRGGQLRFFNPRPDKSRANLYQVHAAREGELLAFRSRLVHEVLPVLAGERHTIVSWLA